MQQKYENTFIFVQKCTEHLLQNFSGHLTCSLIPKEISSCFSSTPWNAELLFFLNSNCVMLIDGHITASLLLFIEERRFLTLHCQVPLSGYSRKIVVERREHNKQMQSKNLIQNSLYKTGCLSAVVISELSVGPKPIFHDGSYFFNRLSIETDSKRKKR